MYIEGDELETIELEIRKLSVYRAFYARDTIFVGSNGYGIVCIGANCSGGRLYRVQ